MEIIRTAAECSRFRACCFSSAALRIIRYSFSDVAANKKYVPSFLSKMYPDKLEFVNLSVSLFLS